MNIIEENKHVYDAIAETFDATRQYLWGDLRPLGTYVKNGDTVLDLGCGNGRLYQLFDEYIEQFRYIGQDQSQKLISHAKKSFPNGEFLTGSMTQIMLSDKTLDAVYCIAAFHHLPDKNTRKECVQEIARTLKPGGTLIISNWNLRNDYVQKKVHDKKYKVDSQDNTHVQVPWRSGDQTVHGWRHYYYISFEELRNMLVPLGFSIKKEYYTSEKEPDATQQSGLNMITIATYDAPTT